MLQSVVLALSLVQPGWMLQAPDASGERQRQEKLYLEGRAQFSAADYAAAIETWTKLLAELPQGPETTEVRLDLLFNIGLAHTREYLFDEDPVHLRKALTLFRLYAERKPSDDVAKRISELEAQLASLEDDDSTLEPPSPEAAPSSNVETEPPRDDAGGPSRGLGIGLVAGGGAAVVGGVALLVAGSRLRPAAEESVAALEGMGLEPDDPAFAEGDAFVDEETRRGRAFMAGGGAVAGVGLVAVGVGVWALTRSRARGGDVAWWVSPTLGGMTMGGRF
ncbi:MAG: hypothetical protein AAGA54_27705 [Myxococcota bacterium]